MTTPFPAIRVGDASLVRPKFSPGLLLEDDDLTRGVEYGRAMQSLLLRAMLGCGVLCGMKVTVKRDAECKLAVMVAKGVAVDCTGALVELPCDQTVDIDLGCAPEALATPLWVVIWRTQRSCAQRDAMCAHSDGDDGGSVPTRLRDGYRIAVLNEEPVSACSAVHDNLDPGLCSCDCDADREHRQVLLARVAIPLPAVGETVTADHSVRRYIRPALKDDPLR